MPKRKYVDMNLSEARMAVIVQANKIIDEYRAQGFDLTLRQLYYQFVARGFIPNKVQEYKRLGDIINDGRLAGYIDWLAIVDRTRALKDLSHWEDPSSIVTAVSEQFRIDKWARQRTRIEVWVEKEALAGVMESVCEELDIPYFACKGYTSQSEMWVAAQRMLKHRRNNQDVTILHFGDHDPSGIDMTRDIRDRLQLFMGGMEVKRIALNMDQVEEYQPPPNPAKLTDSRVGAYLRDFGDESWELDALDPTTLANLVRTEVEALRDDAEWEEAVAEEQRGRDQLGQIAENYDGVIKHLSKRRG